MTNLQTTSAMLGLGLAVVILFLLRRDHIYLRDGLFWIGVAASSLAFGLWPGLIDALGKIAGVAYPPTLLLLLIILALIIRQLLTDLELTRLRRDVRRVNQRLAIMEADREPTVGHVETHGGSRSGLDRDD